MREGRRPGEQPNRFGTTERVLDFAELLAHLVQSALGVGPVESDRGRLLLEPEGSDQRRHSPGLLTEQ